MTMIIQLLLILLFVLLCVFDFFADVGNVFLMKVNIGLTAANSSL